MTDELEKALTPEAYKFWEMCVKVTSVFEPEQVSIGKDIPLTMFISETTEYDKLSDIVLKAKDKEWAILELTSITRDVALAVGFVLGQELDITIPEAQKCLRAIKKVMKEKQAIYWMARERKP